jgi:hypothetical protein
MGVNNQHKATFAEVFGSMKFGSKRSDAPARPWPAPGFAVSKSTHNGEIRPDDHKLIRSSN